MLNRITLAVLGIGFSTLANAGTMGAACAPGSVVVPCEEKRWDLGVQALYLRPVYDADRGYERVSVNGYTQLDTPWNWGYRLEGSYHFNTGNDLNLNWTHFDTGSQQANLYGDVLTDATTIAAGNLVQTVDHQFDQVNLELGQLAHFGQYKSMRFYGGMQYAYIQFDGIQNFAAPYAAVSQFDKADYRGFGPVLGIDYAYNLTSALSLTANSTGSILYGTTRANLGYINVPTNVTFSSIYASKKAIVPSLEAKLGMNYAYAMGQGILNIQGGYQALNYFNALQKPRYTSATVTTLAESDFGLSGPYIGINYTGSV